MTTSYLGVPTLSTSLDLMTDGDSPRAQLFRTPLERLLDTCAYIKAENDARDRKGRLRNAIVQTKAKSSAINDNGCAAFSRGPGYPVLLVKAGASNIFSFTDQGQTATAGVSIASVTAAVTAVAYDPINTRLVAIGSGGNNNSISNDFGATWIAGGAIGGSCSTITWNAVRNLFIVARNSGNAISRSADGVAWTSNTTSLATDCTSVAVFEDGRWLACGLDSGSATAPAFSISTNVGSVWTDTGGTIADPTLYADSGWIASKVNNNVIGGGAASPFVYHVGRRTTGAWLRVSRTTDGTTWETMAEIPASFNVGAGGTFNARAALYFCGNTNLMVIVAPYDISGGVVLFASEDGGATWSNHVTGSGAPGAYSVAGGRVFSGIGTETFASAGIGFGG